MTIRTDEAFYIEFAEGLAEFMEAIDITDDNVIELKIQEVIDYVDHELAFTAVNGRTVRKITDAACDAFRRAVSLRIEEQKKVAA